MARTIMAHVKNKTKTIENKMDMTLDAIIKLQKSEKKKQIKAKKQTPVKKQMQQRNKLGTNVTSLKSVKLTKRKTISGKKQKQQQGQQRLGVQRQHAANQFTENISKKVNKRQDNNRTFSKAKQKGNHMSGRNAMKQQYSKNARENLVNSRRKLQSQQKVNQTKKNRSLKGQQKPKRTEKFTRNKKQNIQDKNPGGNTGGRRWLRRSFDERLNQATENASKLKVKLENPKAKLSSTHSVSARDLIQMQLSSISAVTGKTALSIPENPRPQRQRLSNDQISFKSNPTKLHPLRISVNNDLVQHSLPFNHESRIDIPFDKVIPTLNERFSSMPVDKDDYSITLQGRIPIVID